MKKTTTPARKGKAALSAATVQAAPAPSVPAPVQPPDGWKVQTEYGTLRTRNSVDLVRLEDVHAWMVGQGVPARDAVYKVFGPFYEACLRLSEGGEAEPLIDALHVANARTYPDGLFKANKPSQGQAPRYWASAFPDLGHVRFSDGPGVLVHAMAEGALRVWHGGANINTDHLAARKDRQDRADDATYSIQWPEDEDLRLLLGRLAAPIQTAHALWGYGSAAPFADEGVNAAPNNWTAEAIETMRAEVVAYDKKNRRGGRADAARRYSVTPQRITELLKVKPPAAANPFSGLGGSNGKKAA